MINLIQDQESWVDNISLSPTVIRSWGSDLGFTLETLTPEVDLTVELALLYSSTPEVDLTVELAPLYPSTPEVDSEQTASVKNTQSKSRRNRVNRESVATVLNETASYLYAQGDKDIRFSEWKSKLVFFSSVKHSLCRTQDEAIDVASEFLMWVIKEDKLKNQTHKKVHFNWVQRTMFWQWLTRLREAQGQDALDRHNNKYCRTQQEKNKKTEFHWVASSSATVLKNRNEEGKVTSSDMYFKDQQSREEELDQKKGWSLLFDEVNTMLSSSEDTNKELWASVLSDFLQGKFEGVSKLKKVQDETWANSYSISVKELRFIRSRVLKMLKMNPKIVSIATTYFT